MLKITNFKKGTLARSLKISRWEAKWFGRFGLLSLYGFFYYEQAFKIGKWYCHIEFYYIHIKSMHKDKKYFVFMHVFNVYVVKLNVETSTPFKISYKLNKDYNKVKPTETSEERLKKN